MPFHQDPSRLTRSSGRALKSSPLSSSSHSPRADSAATSSSSIRPSAGSRSYHAQPIAGWGRAGSTRLGAGRLGVGRGRGIGFGSGFGSGGGLGSEITTTGSGVRRVSLRRTYSIGRGVGVSASAAGSTAFSSASGSANLRLGFCDFELGDFELGDFGLGIFRFGDRFFDRGRFDREGASGLALVGERADFDADLLEDFDDVIVAGEHHHLVTEFGEGFEGRGGVGGALAIEVDEDVVEDQRQHDATAGVGGGEGEPEGDEDGFAGAAAEHVQRQRVPVCVVDLELVRPERRPDSGVFARGELVQERGGFAERFGLAFSFERPTDVLEQAAGHPEGLPAAGEGVDLSADALEFESGVGEPAVVGELFHLLGELALFRPQGGDAGFGFADPGGERFPSLFEIAGGGVTDLAGDGVVLDVMSDRRADLAIEFGVACTHFGERRLSVDERVELFGRGDAALGPQRPALLFGPLDRADVGGLVPFELLVLFFQFSATFDPVLLSRELFVQVVQLVERSGARAWAIGRGFGFSRAVTVACGSGLFVELECLQVERFDPFGDRLSFAPSLVAFVAEVG